MGEVYEKTVEVTHYVLELDEQEYEKLREALEMIEGVADESLVRGQPVIHSIERARAIVNSDLGRKVVAVEGETPKWMAEAERYRISEEDLTDEQIVEVARENHLWLNAFACINPSPEFEQEVGRMVIHKLNQSRLNTKGFGEPDARGRKAGESPLVYVRINKS